MSILGSFGSLFVDIFVGFFVCVCSCLAEESLFRSMVPDPSVLQGERRVTDGEREGHTWDGEGAVILDDIGSIQQNSAKFLR